jgi:hypothetical protein
MYIVKYILPTENDVFSIRNTCFVLHDKKNTKHNPTIHSPKPNRSHVSQWIFNADALHSDNADFQHPTNFPLLTMMRTAILAIVLTLASWAQIPEMKTIGDPCNPGIVVPFGGFGKDEAFPRGQVDYTYRIGVTEVTYSQYCQFLNDSTEQVKSFAFNPKMKLTRQGDGTFKVEPGWENRPAAFVSRIAAAEYCNWLSKATVYAFNTWERPDGKTHRRIEGFKDLTTTTQPVLYYLPNMHEFHKAGFYNPRDKTWRTIIKDNMNEPSHYGLENVAEGVSEWMENTNVEATFALGANDVSNSDDDFNAITLHNSANTEAGGDEQQCHDTGFRIAATAKIAVAPKLNDDDNLFTDDSTQFARLRIRSQAQEDSVQLHIEVKDILGNTVSTHHTTQNLKPGANDMPIELPKYDGFFTCNVQLQDGTSLKIPFVVAKNPLPAIPNGHFAVGHHLDRHERGFARKSFDFNRFHQLGATWVRTGSSHAPQQHAAMFERFHKNNLKLLVILPPPNKFLDRIPPEQDIVDKWLKIGISPEHASLAERLAQIVNAGKEHVDAWELGNEPHHWRGYTVGEYADYANVARLVVRHLAPHAKVVLGDIGSIAKPLLTTMGAAKHVDALAVHTYCNFNPNFWGNLGWMRRINGVKRVAGVEDKPIWLTEINICNYSDKLPVPVGTLEHYLQYQAITIPKCLAGMLAYGASKVFVYTMQDPPVDSREEPFGLLDRYGLPKPAFATYRLTAELLGDATFKGFLKGFGTEIGQISAFAFQDSKRQSIALLWRNDQYAFGSYKSPYSQLFKPKQPFHIKGSGSAILVTLDGKRTTINDDKGVFTVPVDEAPCFLIASNLDFEWVDVPIHRQINKVPEINLQVQILPDDTNGSSAMILMNGYDIPALPGEENTIRVRCRNFGDTPLQGTLALVPPDTFSDHDWAITPEAHRVNIIPGGFVTKQFTVIPHQHFKKSQGLTVKAILKCDNGLSATDTIWVKPMKNLQLDQWHSPARGWKLKQEMDGDKLIIYCNPKEGHHPSAHFFWKIPGVIAYSQQDLNKTLKLELQARTPLKTVALLAKDANGEEFLIHDHLQQPQQQATFEFDLRRLEKPDAFIAYGGDNNKKLDFPLRSLGYVISPGKLDPTSIYVEIVVLKHTTTKNKDISQ